MSTEHERAWARAAKRLVPADYDEVGAALASIREVNPDARPTPEELADLALARRDARLAKFLNDIEADRVADLIENHVWDNDVNRVSEQLTIAWLAPLDHSRDDFDDMVKVIAGRARHAAIGIISARRLA